MPDEKTSAIVGEFATDYSGSRTMQATAAAFFQKFCKPMKHMTWLRLQEEAERICSLLRTKGYQCKKRHQRLSWKIAKEGLDEYTLNWIPAPAGEWVVLPNDGSEARQQILQLVDIALSPKLGDSQVCPWTIVRLLPNAQRYTVARFFNRQDAHDHLKILNRFMPAAEFEIVFDIIVSPELEVKS
jgi:hypothetical protein